MKRLATVLLAVLCMVATGCNGVNSSSGDMEEKKAIEELGKETTDEMQRAASKEKGTEKIGAVVYEIPGMDKVEIKKDIVYKVDGNRKLKMDVYYPPEAQGNAAPSTVILVHGSTPDSQFKDSNYFTSWGRLVAASGHSTVTFGWRSGKVPEDIGDLIQYVRENVGELNIDGQNIQVITFSLGVEDGVRQALSINTGFIKAIVAFYGMLPIELLEDVSEQLPSMLIVKAAQDKIIDPHFNGPFIKKAKELDFDVKEIVHTQGEHGFDVLNDTSETYNVIQEALNFLQEHRK